MDSKLKVFNIEGSLLEEKKLEERIFCENFSPELIHRMLVLQLANARSSIAHTKGRSDVRGGGKKPWKQKGTGRARQGTRSAPNFIGGGIVFGPTNERNFSKKMPKKMRRKALYSMLSKRLIEKSLLGLKVDDFNSISTKKVVEFLEKVNIEKKKNILIVYAPESSNEFLLSSRNIANLSLVKIEYLNVFSLIKADCVVFLDGAEDKVI